MSDILVLKARIQARIRFLESTLDPKNRDLCRRVFIMIEAFQIVLDDDEAVASKRRVTK